MGKNQNETKETVKGGQTAGQTAMDKIAEKTGKTPVNASETVKKDTPKKDVKKTTPEEMKRQKEIAEKIAGMSPEEIADWIAKNAKKSVTAQRERKNPVTPYLSKDRREDFKKHLINDVLKISDADFQKLVGYSEKMFNDLPKINVNLTDGETPEGDFLGTPAIVFHNVINAYGNLSDRIHQYRELLGDVDKSEKTKTLIEFDRDYASLCADVANVPDSFLESQTIGMLNINRL